jgi:hypothetical protein
MTKWVSTDYDGCSYVTPGKRYEVFDDKGDGGWIVDDEGDRIFICYEFCFFIVGYSWTVHELTIEPGKYYCTQNGEKVGPMEESVAGDPGGFWGRPHGLYRKDGTFGFGSTCYCRELDIIAEWSDEETGTHNGDNPKTWGEMTDAEKGEIAKAYVTGRAIECSVNRRAWHGNPVHPFADTFCYRIKPKPKRETVTLCGGTDNDGESWGFYTTDANDDRYRITFTTIDGEPDLDSITMERV